MRRVAAAALCIAALAACGDDGDDAQAVPPKAVVRVLAPDSLTEPFQALGARFAELHPGTRVDFFFAASPTLMAEIERGRAGAVLATANAASMRRAVDEGYARAPLEFASNRLAIVVPDGNPKQITDVADLGRADVRLSLCDESVVCGTLAHAALDVVGVDRMPTTTGATARDVLRQVANGSVDAGIVFTTTVVPSEPVDVVGEVTAGADADAVYEISVLAGAVDRDGAQQWVDFVTGAAGQSVLAGMGFGPPPA
jgi:molybdate transport system substrate-binding protein